MLLSLRERRVQDGNDRSLAGETGGRVPNAGGASGNRFTRVVRDGHRGLGGDPAVG